MKKFTLQLAIILFTTSLFAQWIPVNNGLPDFPPTSIINWVDTMVVGTYGGGIYLSYDQGENWSEMPGTLPNLFVNKIDYGGGQYDAIGVATDGGPFICINGGYIDCNGTGLTNNAINWWSPAYGVLTGDYFAGTKGDGIFAANYTSPFIYDWYQESPGLTGDALIITDGVAGEEFALITTQGGVYSAEASSTEWENLSVGLSGDALKVQDLSFLGYLSLIATQAGLYYSMYPVSEWTAIIPDEKFNIVYYINTDISPSGFMVYALGESGFYSQDFETWNEMDFGGIPGEVTAAAADEENLYIGFTTEDKDGKLSGGMYRRVLEDFIVGIGENEIIYNKAVLEQNFPNPFTNSTQISYTLSQQGDVSLKVYDMIGNEVQTIIEKPQQVGRYAYIIESTGLASGIYYYTLKLDNQIIKTRKMIISK